jgi:hypothetical protein
MTKIELLINVQGEDVVKMLPLDTCLLVQLASLE